MWENGEAARAESAMEVWGKWYKLREREKEDRVGTSQSAEQSKEEGRAGPQESLVPLQLREESHVAQDWACPYSAIG